jgi:hypothetical protein
MKSLFHCRKHGLACMGDNYSIIFCSTNCSWWFVYLNKTMFFTVYSSCSKLTLSFSQHTNNHVKNLIGVLQKENLNSDGQQFHLHCISTKWMIPSSLKQQNEWSPLPTNNWIHKRPQYMALKIPILT